MPKIALSVIFKGNEEGAQIDRLLRSVAPHVDAIFATSTWEENGEAAKIFRVYGAHLSHFPWEKDFAKARNFAKDQIPDDYEYMIWLDTDDVLEGGKHIDALLARGLDAYFMEYNYQIDEKTKQVLIKHPRERIVRIKQYKWVGKLHETLIPQVETKTTFVKEMAVNHYPTEEQISVNILRNIEILEKTYAEEKEKDPRTEYYLGRCYYDSAQYAKAEKLFLDYLEHSGWDEERAMAWNYLGEIYIQNEMIDDAIDCYMEAIKERPEFPTWYINLGVAYGKKSDWERALFFTQMGLQMNPPKTAMVTTPRDDKVRALEVVYFACLNTDRLDECVLAAEKLCQFLPEEKTFVERYQAVLHLQAVKQLGQAFLHVVNSYDDTGRVEAIVNNAPEALHGTKLLEKLQQEYTPPKVWPEKSIVYFVGKGFEKWDETNLEKGIGGSETAVIHLAQEWARKGYNVTVFGDPHKPYATQYPTSDPLVQGTVSWRPWWEWNMNDTFDTLIIWRNETLLNTPCKANRVFLDLHDVPNALDYTPERLAKVTKIFVKSAYHRSLLPDVPDEKFIIIPNGIDLSLIPEGYTKETEKPRFIWASSYDRGLEPALEIGWPIIKKAIPDAELHVFYGWNLFDTVHKNNPERQAWKAKIEKLMEQPGVVHHGRVSQKELIAHKAVSLVHYYPTIFEEIDCISVRESAAVGCIPFTTDYAALKGRPYCLRTVGNPLLKETQEKVAQEAAHFVKEVLAGKKVPDTLYTGKAIHADPKAWAEVAQKENWPNIASLWLKEI